MRVGTLTVAAVPACIAVVGTVLPAHAAGKDGRCESREGCLYYNGNRGGSFIDYFYEDGDFAGDRFLSAGAGKGQAVKNNAASAWNRDGVRMRVYYNENFSGPYDEIPAGQAENLVNTWNDNASLNWIY